MPALWHRCRDAEPNTLNNPITAMRHPFRVPFAAFCLFATLTATPVFAQPSSDLPAKDPNRYDETPPTWKSQFPALREHVLHSLHDGKLLSAVETQNKLVELLKDVTDKEALTPKKDADLFMAELKHVMTLPEAKRERYLSAHQKWRSAWKRAQKNEMPASTIIQLQEAALIDFVTVLGYEFRSPAYVLENLATAYSFDEDHLKAAKCFDRALSLIEKFQGVDNEVYSDLAVKATYEFALTGDDKRLDQAETLLRALLARLRKQNLKRTVAYVNALNTFSRLMIQRKKWAEAEAFNAQVISITGDEPTHPAVAGIIATAMLHRAEIEIANEDFNKAGSKLQRSIELFEKVIPHWSGLSTTTLDRYGFVLRKLDRPDDAAKLEAQAKASRAYRRTAKRDDKSDKSITR